MKRSPIFLIGILLCLFYYTPSLSQGCSDAGFCTMGAMRPDQNYQKDQPLKFRFAELSYYQGETRVSATIRAAILDVGFDLFKDYNIHLKLPYMSIAGNFGQISDLGDISVSISRHLMRIGDFDFNATIGSKIPTNRSNLENEEEGVVLPMYYQTSLGTYDLVMGGAFINNSWLFSFGYQQPLVHVNENTFWARPEEWAWYPGGMDYVRAHANANMLRRGADVMVRVERNFRFSRFNANIGLLPIYRISNDQIMNLEGIYEKVEGGRGLAASLLAGAGYRFNTKAALKALYGLRLVDRAKNPDGLSRESVLSLTFNYNF